ncbi:oxidoreductase [Synechococcus sp. KORDI-52]|uniref:Gfo/Idh/MocA family protein n=1 Tax=Synechococcus sp. KORDI-52 TaxID=585425 RepID=UPI0004E04E1C|nr:Gfo/Idh/MocA family oxidoreductase [Synechococcus sp. KORDI-52]AII48897.1 oxidoreductase [Synechococcus sp. KORDI-52]
MSPQPIGVAVAGLGFGEKVHLPALAAASDLQAVALWHPRQERLDAATAVHGLKGYTDWDALLADPAVEAVVIATPPAPRFGLARRALEAGKHLMLEKPIALHADQARELQRLAMARGLSVAVDYEYRAVPLFMQAARLLQAGAVGTPWLVKLDWLMGSRADPQRGWNWYAQADQGGGVIGALGTHACDMLNWLIGPMESLQAVNSVSIKQRPQPGGGLAAVDAPDVSLLQAVCHWQGRPEQPVPAQVSLSSVSRNGRGFCLDVVGASGSLLLSSTNQKDYVHGFELQHAPLGEPFRSLEPDADLTFPETWSDGRIAPVARVLGWWAESIRTGQPMVPGLSEGVMSRDACDRVEASVAHL